MAEKTNSIDEALCIKRNAEEIVTVNDKKNLVPSISRIMGNEDLGKAV